MGGTLPFPFSGLQARENSEFCDDLLGYRPCPGRHTLGPIHCAHRDAPANRTRRHRPETIDRRDIYPQYKEMHCTCA